ncbi:hypothetical protein [Novosphingobium sp. AP12]|jgi:hypothetical protein|uniref:hypothetical protein n=1 Tax=Novosphingobium sp. AP12 TaxID=1144305 RepID=UPI0002720F69|nr:hypothetical protein [Novosphingobium sp. AP12]EJL34987.1 hypothetical protein PMI02_00361 [Novosphingobium sp. AP12]
MASEPGRPAKRMFGTRADCREERHVASAKITVTASGIQSCRCRICGCELRRIPSLRRWFRSGMMG